MNNNQEKQFETKLATAVMMFAMQLQNVMEKVNDEMAESIATKYEANPDMSVEEIAKEFAKHTVSALSKEYKLGDV